MTGKSPHLFPYSCSGVVALWSAAENPSSRRMSGGGVFGEAADGVSSEPSLVTFGAEGNRAQWSRSHMGKARSADGAKRGKVPKQRGRFPKTQGFSNTKGFAQR